MTGVACEKSGMLERARLGLLAVGFALGACSSSSAVPSRSGDAGALDGQTTSRPDAAARADGTVDATASSEAAADAPTQADARDATSPPPDAHDAALLDAAPDAPFVFPDGAIPHDTGADAGPASPCSSLPDLSTYCGTVGSSSAIFTCMQGNGVASPCSGSTVCVLTDAGGAVCETP
jgi:hypothetical protein